MINMIFDMDGCVIDSSEVQKAAFFGSYQEIVGDDKCPSYEEYIKFTGDSIDNVLAKLNLPAEMATPFRRISSQSVDKVIVNWDVINYVRHVRSLGAKTAICTGKDRYRTIDILEHYKIKDCFDVLVCADDVVETKPSPIPVLKALDGLKCSEKEAIVIGDGYSDILSAKAAGVKSVLTLWFGDNGVPRVADYIAKSVEDLESIATSLMHC